MKKQTDSKKKTKESVVSYVKNLRFNRSDIFLNPTPFGIRIVMKDFYFDGEPGAPALPHKIIRIALPKGHGFKKLTMDTCSSLLLNHTPEPVISVQEPSIGSTAELPYRSFKRSFALPSKEKYMAAFNLGKKICRFAGEEMIGLIPVALIEIWPVRYTKEGLLELVEEVTLTIDSAPSAEIARKEKENLLRLTPKKIVRQHIFLNETVVNNSVVEKVLRKNIVDLKNSLVKKPALAEKVKLSKGLSVPPECDYLILTDDNTWDALTIQPISLIGDITSQFQQLANWKKARGLRTYVARVKDIVDGKYGNFKTGARDLQEVIRNFLKWFCRPHGVEFVLLGGDVSIIPVRQAASCAWGQIGFGSLDKKNNSEWKGSYLGMRIDKSDFGLTTHSLTNYDTGQVIPYDSAGTSNTTTPGWYHTTDNTFATRSAVATEWVRVNGPSAQVNAKMVWYTDMNLIPTDLYYSSLYGAGYSIPGKHDWDHLNNNLYGQHNAAKNFDNVEYHADVTIGRASVETIAEAEAFIKKVLEYEKWGSIPRPDSDYDRFRAMLFAASTWRPFIRVVPDGTNAIPPANNKYTPSGETVAIPLKDFRQLMKIQFWCWALAQQCIPTPPKARERATSSGRQNSSNMSGLMMPHSSFETHGPNSGGVQVEGQCPKVEFGNSRR